MEVKQNYISRTYVSSEGRSTFDNINPSNGAVIDIYPNTTHREVQEVCSLAKDKFYEWRNVSRFTRSEYFFKIAKILEIRKNEVAYAISLETGKSFNEASAEVNEALHMAQYVFGC